MKCLIIIPAYNEEQAILNTVTDLTRLHPDVDVLVINDCSKDHTRDILRSNGIRHLDLPLNLGIGGAVQSGYLYAREYGYDIAVQMDGDGLHPASELEKLLAPFAADEADIVIGSRFVTGEGFQSTGMRRAGINFLSSLIRLCSGVKVKDVTSGYRAVNRKMINIFAEEYAQDYPEPDAIVTAAKHGARVMEVPVLMKERQGGVSSISPLKSIYYMIKVSIAIVVRRLAK